MYEEDDERDKKIKELEEEVARLKGQVVVSEGEYMGRPVLRFSGPFKPFSLGVSKCRVILKVIDKIKAFVEKYNN